MQLWQDTSDYAESLAGVIDGAAGRFVFEKAIYTGMKYGARFFNQQGPQYGSVAAK